MVERWGEKWTEIDGRGQRGQDTEVGHWGKMTGTMEGQREEKSGRERETDKGGGRAERQVDRGKTDRWRERVTNKHRAGNPKIWGVNTGGGIDAGGR